MIHLDLKLTFAIPRSDEQYQAHRDTVGKN